MGILRTVAAAQGLHEPYDLPAFFKSSIHQRKIYEMREQWATCNENVATRHQEAESLLCESGKKYAQRAPIFGGENGEAGRGGLLDRNYAMRAQDIATGKITADQLAEAMSEIIPNDALFRTAFAEQRVSQAFLARYYLRALEQKVKGEPEPEFVPTEEENIINLEHVLPENPEENWPGFDANTASAFYKRLGNMVLMQAKKNMLIGNGTFGSKRKTLKASAYILTSEVATPNSWGPKQINDRQARLADLAILTWPIKP